MTSLNELTAHELRDLLREGKTSSRDIRESVLKKIHARDKEIHAYVRLHDPAATVPNQAGDQTIPGIPVPIAVKDNLCIRGRPTTCCSQILQGFTAPYNATVIEKLFQAGIPVIGQTNMDEFAFGSSTETSCYGPTCNPWNTACVPGGSSGGSAAAVAAGEAVWALGSDTGGSIRQPASFCGVVGLKPTYGRVSRYGLIAFASSLDQIGPMTRDVTDAALLLGLIAGFDPKDSTSVDVPVPDYARSLVKDVQDLKIGIPSEYFQEGIDPDVAQAVRGAIGLMKERGATFVEVSLPHTEYCVATYYIVATAEASSNLARYDGVQYGLRRQSSGVRKSLLRDMYGETRARGFGPEAKRRIMLGTYALSAGYYDAYYLRGQKARTLIKGDFDRVFKEVDAVITPTSPTTAFRIGEKTNDPLSMYLSDIFTISANLSGIPAISVPCGFSSDGLPIGLQIMTKAFDEETLFRIAYTVEQSVGENKRKSP